VSNPQDVLFGNIALKRRLISGETLQRALMYQRAKAPSQPLGQILQQFGFLTPEQVQEILTHQQRAQQTQTGRHLARGFPSPPGPVGLAHAGHPTAPPPGPNLPVPGAAMDFEGGGGGPAVALGPTPNPDQDPLLGETIGGCRVNAKIGSGGMARVYLAHHESLERDMVVKVLSEESAENHRTVERFFREARALARLEHPNIVMVHDVGTTERGLHFMVMQYVHGQDLEDVIAAKGRFEPAQALRVIKQVAQGLEVAHAAEVIHRDIKAENLLVAPEGTVKIADFGLAKDLTMDPMTLEGAFVGTPIYMAPEIGREEIDGRVDVYSLGITFYYLLTGVQPMREFSAMEILRAQAHAKIKAPEAVLEPLGVELPEGYREVVGKAIAVDRAERYQDMTELLRDLEALERGFPVDAGPPKVWTAATKSSARWSKNKKSSTKPTRTTSGTAKLGTQGASPALLAALGGLILLVLVLAAILIWAIMG
jgi:eukaryotic-like serine/threonine-protein kinase